MSEEEKKRQKIITVNISDIKLYPGSPYRPVYPGKRLSLLAESIAKDGLQYPLLCDPELNLIDGQWGLEAMKSLHWEQCQVIITTNPDATRLAMGL